MNQDYLDLIFRKVYEILCEETSETPLTIHDEEVHSPEDLANIIYETRVLHDDDDDGYPTFAERIDNLRDEPADNRQNKINEISTDLANEYTAFDLLAKSDRYYEQRNIPKP